jgi:hypothetical protein
MLLRPFLNVHIHSPAGVQVECADVNLATNEFECEAVAGNKQPGFTRTGNRGPRSLKLIKIGSNSRLGRRGRCDRWHGVAPRNVARQGVAGDKALPIGKRVAETGAIITRPWMEAKEIPNATSYSLNMRAPSAPHGKNPCSAISCPKCAQTLLDSGRKAPGARFVAAFETFVTRSTRSDEFIACISHTGFSFHLLMMQ